MLTLIFLNNSSEKRWHSPKNCIRQDKKTSHNIETEEEISKKITN